MNSKVEVVYNGKVHAGFVKSVESLVNASRNATGRLVLSKIMGYEVELFDSESHAIIKLQVDRFSDIRVIT